MQLYIHSDGHYYVHFRNLMPDACFKGVVAINMVTSPPGGMWQKHKMIEVHTFCAIMSIIYFPKVHRRTVLMKRLPRSFTFLRLRDPVLHILDWRFFSPGLCVFKATELVPIKNYGFGYRNFPHFQSTLFIFCYQCVGTLYYARSWRCEFSGV